MGLTSTTSPTTKTLNNTNDASSLPIIFILLGEIFSRHPTKFAATQFCLFSLGFAFSVVVDHLQKEHDVTRYPADSTLLLSTASWIPFTCGIAACGVGTLYPWMDVWCTGKPHVVKQEWSSVLRCCGGFIGVNYAASKLPWTSSAQVSITLALLALGLWFIFDRTLHGFFFSLVISVVGTIIVQLFVAHGVYSYTRADFFGVRSWFPCVLYASCICFGSIGRQLSVVPDIQYLIKKLGAGSKLE
ncbi:hypothetical protein SmJEL517_g04463 [Synchytrium microbalum]|uniref:Uncharacterized protein n=1 Tax=Synchytrium microbalum TaxID=1806994 RepID=A0A507BYB9_9FUNG|nr:uncharacterized protein SmJEL517_g04463 [Synchytrium microbalum]TPX32422.1 hypothetical protein SmJEL517_g04463 [Synchytrium microbalum]